MSREGKVRSVLDQGEKAETNIFREKGGEVKRSVGRRRKRLFSKKRRHPQKKKFSAQGARDWKNQNSWTKNQNGGKKRRPINEEYRGGWGKPHGSGGVTDAKTYWGGCFGVGLERRRLTPDVAEKTNNLPHGRERATKGGGGRGKRPAMHRMKERWGNEKGGRLGG